ncbi:MAG: sulfatase-modifying factor protein, partial [Ignavibacteriales bacterium]|nr:sulfatase-modifying factor protein [Ignavibacteriales bacterium]
MLKRVAFGVALCAHLLYGQAMNLTHVEGSVEAADDARLTAPAPLFSLLIEGDTYFSDNVAATERDGKTVLDFGALSASIEIDETFDRGAKATVVLTNETDSIIVVENVVPFGAVEKRIHITSTGPWALNRAKLFRPGKTPVSLTLPDNAWEMGYGAAELEDGRSVCAIARRVAVEEADKKRYETRLKPGGSATYDFYADAYEGEWQNGLALMFQDRYLYDLVEFDDSLYQREDQQWIRRVYLMYIEQSWDHDFLERFTGELGFFDLLDEGERLFGGYDAYHLWPTWPNLGLDPRNQFDLHEDLPGGIPALRKMFDEAKERGVKLFVTYNPWDRSTREVDHFRGLAEMLVDLNADGVILDTYWKSSDELQHMADSIRPGIVMYSEGMATPEHLPGIVSGRVHDAFRYQSVLNLNKLIKPDFAFFRVLQLVNGRYHREAAISLFN